MKQKQFQSIFAPLMSFDLKLTIIKLHLRLNQKVPRFKMTKKNCILSQTSSNSNNLKLLILCLFYTNFN